MSAWAWGISRNLGLEVEVLVHEPVDGLIEGQAVGGSLVRGFGPDRDIERSVEGQFQTRGLGDRAHRRRLGNVRSLPWPGHGGGSAREPGAQASLQRCLIAFRHPLGRGPLARSRTQAGFGPAGELGSHPARPERSEQHQDEDGSEPKHICTPSLASSPACSRILPDHRATLYFISVGTAGNLEEVRPRAVQ